MKITKHVIVHGRVQGVNFRESMRMEAQRLGVTGWVRLDPLIALAVAANIIWSGLHLLRRSVLGLMDTALPEDQRQAVLSIQKRYAAQGIQFHALRTREAGARAFVSMHVLVPGQWTVRHGHTLIESVEADVRQALPTATVFTHLEPLEDPVSWDDTQLSRADPVG